MEIRVVRFWSEILLVISSRTLDAHSSDFKTTRMIADQIHSTDLHVKLSKVKIEW